MLEQTKDSKELRWCKPNANIIYDCDMCDISLVKVNDGPIKWMHWIGHRPGCYCTWCFHV